MGFNSGFKGLNQALEDDADNVTSGFRREVDENCAVLMVPIGCPETSVTNLQ